ncbi:MAG: DUF86 domain-containing protein [Candidatus Hodarchaeota archaeon]
MRVDIIIQKLEQIIENISLIHNNLPDKYSKFESLGLVKDGIYKRLDYSIELVIDICSIINADLKLGLPNGESEIITNLVNKKIINSDLEEAIRGMKSFRNILVHRYGKIDDQISYNLLKQHLDDFETFRIEILNYLKRNEHKKSDLNKENH